MNQSIVENPLFLYKYYEPHQNCMYVLIDFWLPKIQTKLLDFQLVQDLPIS